MVRGEEVGRDEDEVDAEELDELEPEGEFLDAADVLFAVEEAFVVHEGLEKHDF